MYLELQDQSQSTQTTEVYMPVISDFYTVGYTQHLKVVLILALNFYTRYKFIIFEKSDNPPKIWLMFVFFLFQGNILCILG